MLQHFFDYKPEVLAVDQTVMQLCRPYFEKMEQIRDYNQLKMLKAFTDNNMSATHLQGTSGYGLWDSGRDKLEEIFAQLVGAEDALVRSQFMSGTHTLAVALCGVLRTGDTLVAATGRPYDTLEGVIGLDGKGKGNGTLMDYGIRYDEAPLKPDFTPDYELIAQKAPGAKVCHIQRSRGYLQRNAFDLGTIQKIADTARAANPDIIIFVDNCYGEFTQTKEPTQAGADLIVGSLIKNPGGGIAPTGGYIAGRADLVQQCAYRLSAPGLGKELGCTLETLREMYLGLYYAPGVVCDAIKTAIYAQCLLEQVGVKPVPRYCDDHNDIVTCFDSGSAEALIGFCQGIQAASPVDSYVAPMPSMEPGYTDQVIMAAGAFTMGSTIELSCDGPLREPYTCYLQGGLNFTASRAGVLLAVQKAFFREN
ncbi:MAG: methionine gamma-lyase family protein [Faecalibacterium sp.]|nr:methionine gamma-lyase family protein [Faecalibacterium sp.]